MTDKPILFSSPMVQAVWEGQKTQTRRKIKLNQKDLCDPLISYAYGRKQYSWPNARKANGDLIWFEPPWQSGDKLWVRETWGLNHIDYENKPIPKKRPKYLENYHIAYRATENYPKIQNDLFWRPSIHMPRWASRITLIVADVQVQRLQDITEADARAEGFKNIGEFADYWNSLTKTHQWHENPWVSIITFKPIFENIDKVVL